MVNFLSTLLLGLIAAVIGAVIQQRTWRHRSLVELREREYAEAKLAVEHLSISLDQRLEAQRTYTSLVMSGVITPIDIEEYKKATAFWMGSFSSNKAKIYHSFDRSTVEDFEEQVQKALQHHSAVVSLGRRHGAHNLSTLDRKQFLSSEKKLNIVQYNVYKFLNKLNDRISSGDIGKSKAINDLNTEDLSMISSLYLVRRLLGIDGNIRRTY